MFQCITVASRPLRVEELAEFLAFDFEATPIPTFLPDWRPDDPRDAVLSICSSLIAIVKVNGPFVIQFSHFSVKEFLTSSHLAIARDQIFRRYYVPTMPAHTIVARACLGILLHLDVDISNHSLKSFPLAAYAARHWVDHANFVNVSSSLQGGMKLLFDPRKPHFSVWVWIYDPDARWIQSQRSRSLSQPRGRPLHYAALYGLRDVAEFLIIERSQGVNTRSGSRNVTPLFVASDKGHLDVMRLLLEHGADPNVRDGSSNTPLHGVSQRGHVKIARVLLEYGAHPDVRGIGDLTPLRLALQGGHLKVARALLEHNANADTRDHFNRTPLHQASQEGDVDVAQVLLNHRADANSQDLSNWTPLHWASQWGHVQVARVLLDHGAEVDAHALDSSTPLHLALQEGHLEMIRLLLDHGAFSNSRDRDNCTTLHWASRRGHLQVASVLLEHGADPNSRDNNKETPLHQLLEGEYLEVARVLLEHGADPNSQNSNKETPLHRASQRGHLEIARVLLDHRADPNSLDFINETPLHRASQYGYPEVTRVLLERGADSNGNPVSNVLRRTSEHRRPGVARIAHTSALRDPRSTPLHLASQSGSLEVARLLLDNGADVNARNGGNKRPLDVALSVEMSILLASFSRTPRKRMGQGVAGVTGLHRLWCRYREGRADVGSVP